MKRKKKSQVKDGPETQIDDKIKGTNLSFEKT